MKKLFTCLLAALGLNTACSQDFENADVKGFAELIADSDVVVLDVRTAEEFNEAHIANAIHIDQFKKDFIEQAKKRLPVGKTIAVYCRSGRRSANAAGLLAKEGYKPVNLKGGIMAWKEENMPVVRTSLKKVYDEQINPMEQIDQAVVKAQAEGKFVVCQVGGNWCPWCLRFADFITNDSTINTVIAENFVYIHVNYDPRQSKSGGQQSDGQPSGADKAQLAKAMLQRLDNPARFGFPVFVVLDESGKVLHIQDSSFLEEGQGYSKEKVLRFFKNWTPEAVR